MGWSENLALLAAGLYLLGTLAMLAGLVRRGPALRRLALGLTAAGFALHTAVLIISLHGFDGNVLARGIFAQIFAWILLLLYFIVWRLLNSAVLGLAVAPVAFIAYFLSFTVHTSAVPGAIKGLFGVVHLGSLACSAALATIAFIAGLLFIYMDNKLKHKARLSDFDRDMPGLAVFDRINHIAALAGFPLFTLGMFAGFFNAGRLWGEALSWDPKEIVSIFVWLVYGAWFLLRLRGRRGRKAAFMAIATFLFCIFSMFGVNLLMESHHNFKA